jgi:hypothetical protein
MKWNKQKSNKCKRRKSEVPVIETSPNKAEMRAIGQGKDKEQRMQSAVDGNIDNYGGPSKNGL